MTIKFILISNNQGQIRLTKYFDKIDNSEKASLEVEVMKRTISRHSSQCSFYEFQDFKIVYKRYGVFYIIFGIDHDENEIAILEIIHFFAEQMETYLQTTEKDLVELKFLIELDKVHLILDEIFINGEIIETNQFNILDPVDQLYVEAFDHSI